MEELGGGLHHARSSAGSAGSRRATNNDMQGHLERMGKQLAEIEAQHQQYIAGRHSDSRSQFKYRSTEDEFEVSCGRDRPRAGCREAPCMQRCSVACVAVAPAGPSSGTQQNGRCEG